MQNIDYFQRLMKESGTTKSHKTVRTRAYAVVLIIVGQKSWKVCFLDAKRSAGYDMDFEGTFQASNVFVRELAWASTQIQNAS